MSNVTDNQELDTCGCCESALEEQPPHFNPPGQQSIEYRIGTQPTFLRRMMERVPFEAIPDGPNISTTPLAGLITGTGGDPAVALLDAWAASLDVLTFYQERIANEGYLRTAVERRSVLELARSIGYELNPGVAAGTQLVFTVDPAIGVKKTVTIPIGAQVQNVPVDENPPQTFETIESIDAVAELNNVGARMTEHQVITAASTGVFINGTSTFLQVGDVLLLVGDERKALRNSTLWYWKIVTAVTPSTSAGYTFVSWGGPLASTGAPIPTNVQVYAFRQRASLFGHNAPDWKSMSQGVKDAYGNGTDWPRLTVAETSNIDMDLQYPKVLNGSWALFTGLAQQGTGATTFVARLYQVSNVVTTTRVDFTLASRVTRFQTDQYLNPPLTAQTWNFLVRETALLLQSELLELAEVPADPFFTGNVFVVDRVIEEITKGRMVVVSGKQGRVQVVAKSLGTAVLTNPPDPTKSYPKPARGEVLRVVSRRTSSSFNPFASKASFASLAGGLLGARLIGTTTTSWTLQGHDGLIWTVSAQLGDDIIAYDADPGDDDISIVALATDVIQGDEHTTVNLSNPVTMILDRATVTLYGNVAQATHGATISEVLGSGNGAVGNQRFALKKPPLTYTPAATVTGNKTTLEVRVNGVRWSEVPYLFRRSSRDQVYMVRMNNDGVSSVIFGDGANGVRIPTGIDNVTAVYRAGIGPIGQVPANTITTLQTRPLGIRTVTNPLPSTGAAPPEVLDRARQNAPRTVLTFDRIVSLNDYEDFARSFAGVGKVRGVLLWNGNARHVHLTVADQSGNPASATLLSNLVSAIGALRDTSVQMSVGGFTPKFFNVTATLVVDARYISDDVVAAARAALISAFSFDNRSFGQRVAASEVISVLQRVPGVIAVTLDRLEYAVDSSTPLTGSTAAVTSAVGAPTLLAATIADPATTCTGAITGVIGSCAAIADGVLVARSATWKVVTTTAIGGTSQGKIREAELLLINTGADGIKLNTTQEQQ